MFIMPHGLEIDAKIIYG